MFNFKSKNGITLVSLVVTVIVLLILAAVSIDLAIGENGFITQAKEAMEQNKIEQYKEDIDLVKEEVRLKNNGELTLEKLKEGLEDSNWVNSVEVIEDDVSIIKLTTDEAYIFYITLETTEYRGKNGEVIETPIVINISANPENKTDVEVESVSIDITVECSKKITSAAGYYAWKQEENAIIADNEWSNNILTLNENGNKSKIGNIQASQSNSGNYYLWIKAVINGEVKIQKFGEYKFEGKPTEDNLTCEMTSKNDLTNPTEGTVTVGSNKAFTGWTCSYTVTRNSSTIDSGNLEGGTTTTVTAIKGDTVTVKYTKTGETDLVKSLTADELKIAYKLIYNTKGGQNTPEDDVQYDNNVFTVTSSVPTKKGNTLEGWYLNEEGTGTKYSGGDSITVTNESHQATLFAKWGQYDFDNAGLLGVISRIQTSGYFDVSVTGRTSETANLETVTYNLHTIIYNGDMVLDGTTSYSSYGISLSDKTYLVGNESTDCGTQDTNAPYSVVLKVIGNLTINKDIILTSCKNSSGYGGPKGLLIYCSGTLTNNGTISMTKGGAKAVGQNVYLWKNSNTSYEFVPKAGVSGAKGGSGQSSYNGKAGGKPTAASSRLTGGGGGGAGQYTGYKGGAGGAGTSYSGGPGGGGGRRF